MSSRFMYGKLDAQKRVVEATREEFGKVFEGSDRIIGQTSFGDGWLVSTVFLGLNHGWGRSDQWFETMIFDPEKEASEQARYETYDQAVAGHNEQCKILSERLGREGRLASVEEMTRVGHRKMFREPQ